MSSTLTRDQEGSVCPRASFPLSFSKLEQWLSQQAAQGRRSSPQGPCPAQTTATGSLVVFETENYRHFFGMSPNEMHILRTKCCGLFCILTKVLSLRRLLFLVHAQLLSQFYLFFTLQKINSHKYLNSKKPSIFC